MYENHLEFLRWAVSYDEGDINMRSKAKHDKWQRLLSWLLFAVDGNMSTEENFKKIFGC